MRLFKRGQLGELFLQRRKLRLQCLRSIYRSTEVDECAEVGGTGHIFSDLIGDLEGFKSDISVALGKANLFYQAIAGTSGG